MAAVDVGRPELAADVGRPELAADVDVGQPKLAADSDVGQPELATRTPAGRRSAAHELHFELQISPSFSLSSSNKKSYQQLCLGPPFLA